MKLKRGTFMSYPEWSFRLFGIVYNHRAGYVTVAFYKWFIELNWRA